MGANPAGLEPAHVSRDQRRSVGERPGSGERQLVGQRAEQLSPERPGRRRLQRAGSLGRRLSVNTSSCPSAITIQAQIANTGSLGVAAGVPVGFYQGHSPGWCAARIRKHDVALLPGQTETLLMEFMPESGDIGPWDFYVTVDDEAAGLSLALECGEDNNEGSVGAARCVVVQ